MISPAGLLSSNLISLVDLSAFLIMQFDGSKAGYQSKRHHLVSYFICIFSFLALFLHAIFHFIWAVEGDQWFAINSNWAKLAGFERIYSWRPPSELYFLLIQISIALVALRRILGGWLGQDLQGDSHLERFCSSPGYIGFNILLLYSYQLPIEFSELFVRIADFVGLYKITAKSEWSQLCCGVSLLSFYILVSRSCSE
ncbi:hypothetical protein NL676_030754 [Syzygium grande]|nr:hypothetical protein NL676_030754 [Syzygium grande]